jgi:SAM-dependent methyltransferase
MESMEKSSSSATAPADNLTDISPTYKGRRIQAPPEVHVKAVQVLQRLLRPAASVLDIAAGQGALTARAMDAGFTLASTSWNDKAGVEGVPVYNIDLDHPFGPDDVGGRQYDAVLCVEVIEHVQSPATLLASMRRVLRDDGCLVISTPNVESALSRLQILKRGYPEMFSTTEVTQNRHIAVPLRNVLDQLCRLAGFDIVERHFLPPEKGLGSGLGRLVKSAALYFVTRFTQGDVHGANRMYVLRKAAPQPDSPTEYY